MDSFDDIWGEFDDILGPDVPDEYNKDSINRRLIDAYKKILQEESKSPEFEKIIKKLLEFF